MLVGVGADQMVNLKLSSKQMIRASKKCEKGEADAKSKLKKAIEQGNYEGAKIYAQVPYPKGRFEVEKAIPSSLRGSGSQGQW